MGILSKFKNRMANDELCGKWHTDDGSGFMIVMGSSIEFCNNGTGSYQSWWTDDDGESFNSNGKFTWIRIEGNKISIQEENSDEIELIEYKIKIINGREELSSKQESKKSNSIEGFWNFMQVMFRHE